MKYRLYYNLLFSLAVVSILMVFAFFNVNQLVKSSEDVEHTYKMLGLLDQALKNLTDAESGQRGYIITGKDDYLEPYYDGINTIHSTLNQLNIMSSENPAQQKNIKEFYKLVDGKISELKYTLSSPKELAISKIKSGVGRNYMDAIRSKVIDMKYIENSLLFQRTTTSYNVATRCLVVFPTVMIVTIVLNNISLGLALRDGRA